MAIWWVATHGGCCSASSGQQEMEMAREASRKSGTIISNLAEMPRPHFFILQFDAQLQQRSFQQDYSAFFSKHQNFFSSFLSQETKEIPWVAVSHVLVRQQHAVAIMPP